jgi:hypothetical protein
MSAQSRKMSSQNRLAPRCPRNPWLCPLNLPNPSTMSAQSRKMSSQYHPTAMMSAQFLIMSSQSPKSINYVRSIAKDVLPISSGRHDVRAIPNYVLSIFQIHPLCPLKRKKCPPNSATTQNLSNTTLQNSIFPPHLVLPLNNCYIKFNNSERGRYLSK